MRGQARCAGPGGGGGGPWGRERVGWGEGLRGKRGAGVGRSGLGGRVGGRGGGWRWGCGGGGGGGGAGGGRGSGVFVGWWGGGGFGERGDEGGEGPIPHWAAAGAWRRSRVACGKRPLSAGAREGGLAGAAVGRARAVGEGGGGVGMWPVVTHTHRPPSTGQHRTTASRRLEGWEEGLGERIGLRVRVRASRCWCGGCRCGGVGRWGGFVEGEVGWSRSSRYLFSVIRGVGSCCWEGRGGWVGVLCISGGGRQGPGGRVWVRV